MLEETVYYRYFRCIPKGWREYIKQQSEDEESNRWSLKKINAPHRFQRHHHNHGFRDGWPLYEVPPDPRGGITECYIECKDTDTGQTVIFKGVVKCSKDDIFSYKIGRELALSAATQERDKWKRQK